MKKVGLYGRIELNCRELKWFKLCYPFCHNADLMQRFGLSHSTMHRIAKRENLEKDKTYLKWLGYRTAYRIARIKEERGTQTPKGTIPPNCEKARFQKGNDIIARVGGVERFRQIREKANSTRNKTLHKDKLRRQYGLSPITKFRNLGNKQKKSVYMWRASAKRRGYIIEQTGGMVVRYNSNTNRGEIFERNGKGLGFKILAVGEKLKQLRVIRRTDGVRDIQFAF